MNEIRKFAALALAIMVVYATCIVASAKNVENGELIFTGGQTSSVVYSDIRDAKPKNNKKYKVMAKVKVGGNTYISGWKNDKAYKQAERHWYTNESSYYDYYLR